MVGVGTRGQLRSRVLPMSAKRPGRPNKTGLPPGTEGQRELRLRCAPDLLAAIALRGGSEWVRRVLAREIATDGCDPVTGFGPESRQ
jgi:hypothetical protein